MVGYMESHNHLLPCLNPARCEHLSTIGRQTFKVKRHTWDGKDDGTDDNLDKFLN